MNSPVRNRQSRKYETNDKSSKTSDSEGEAQTKTTEDDLDIDTSSKSKISSSATADRQRQLKQSSKHLHRDSSIQLESERDRDRDGRRKNRLVSPSSVNSSPVTNRIGSGSSLNAKLSPSDLSHFLNDSTGGRSYHSSQLINKENETIISPGQFYSVGGESQSASMIENRDRVDRNGHYSGHHHHYHNRHASQMDHYRSGSSSAHLALSNSRRFDIDQMGMSGSGSGLSTSMHDIIDSKSSKSSHRHMASLYPDGLSGSASSKLNSRSDSRQRHYDLSQHHLHEEYRKRLL